MANKELANQWKHGCMHGMYAWNDLGTPTPIKHSLHLFIKVFEEHTAFQSLPHASRQNTTLYHGRVLSIHNLVSHRSHGNNKKKLALRCPPYPFSLSPRSTFQSTAALTLTLTPLLPNDGSPKKQSLTTSKSRARSTPQSWKSKRRKMVAVAM